MVIDSLAPWLVWTTSTVGFLRLGEDARYLQADLRRTAGYGEIGISERFSPVSVNQHDISGLLMTFGSD